MNEELEAIGQSNIMEDPMEEGLEAICKRYRTLIKKIADNVLTLKNHEDFKSEQLFTNQHNEMQDNIMLSYRHLEDARMRLGKVMQQIQGGISIFDREKNPEKVNYENL